MKPPLNPWRQFIWDNARWMLASLFLAFGLWMIAVLQTDPVEERNFTRSIPIEYRLAETILITNTPISEAIVTIRAPRSVLNALRADQIEVVADLKGRGAGLQRVDLTATLAEGLRGEIVDISPRRVEIMIEEKASKRLPIITQVTQDPPSGFTYPAPTCTLTEVTAQGPASTLETAVVVARLNLSEYRNPVTLNATLQPVNEFGRAITGVSLEVSQVECKIEIAPIAGVSELSVVPTVEGFPPSGYIYEGFEFTPRTVIVRGNPRAIRDMNGVVNTTPIDLSAATTTFERTLNAVLPEGVQLLPDTQTITVTVKIGTVQGSRQYTEIPLEVDGLRSDLAVTLLPETVTVFAVGPQPLLETLTAQDMRVLVNLENDQVGTYQKPVQVSVVIPEVNSQLQLTVQPPEINVTIETLTSDTLPPTP